MNLLKYEKYQVKYSQLLRKVSVYFTLQKYLKKYTF